MSLGDRLREEIEIRSKSIKSFANKTGMPYGSIMHYVNDGKMPGANALSTFAEHGVDVAYILTGKKPGIQATKTYSTDVETIPTCVGSSLPDPWVFLPRDWLSWIREQAAAEVELAVSQAEAEEGRRMPVENIIGLYEQSFKQISQSLVIIRSGLKKHLGSEEYKKVKEHYIDRFGQLKVNFVHTHIQDE